MVRPYRAGDGSQAGVSGKRVQRVQVTWSCRQGVPGKVGSEPLPLVPLHGSAPPLGTTVTLESQITFCEA